MKLLPSELARDDSNVQRVKLEAKALAQLKHPNIITTFDFGSTYMQEPFIVMEYVAGESLKEILDREVLLPLNRAIRIFLQVVDAMRYAHGAGILHRDLKPHNVMVSNEPEQDHVKVLDFGVAKLAEYTQKITRTGEVVGSPLYMSPEQCTGRPTDQRCDIYSVGVMMFETLTGSPPFRGENYISTVHLKCTKLAPNFRDVVPGKVFPEKLEMIVLKCLEIEPDNRYSSMAELKGELELVAGTLPKTERPKAGSQNSSLSTTGSATAGFRGNSDPISPIKSSAPGTGEVGWKPSWSGETTPTPSPVPSPSSYDKWSDSIASIETSDKELFGGPQQAADTGGLSRGSWSGPGTEVGDDDARRPAKPSSVASDRIESKPQIGKLLTQDLASLSAALEASTVERTKTSDRLPAQNPPASLPEDITGDRPVVGEETQQTSRPVPVPDAKNKQGDSHFVLTWDSKSGPSWSATSAAPQKQRPPAPAPAPLSPPRANPTGSNPILSDLVAPTASRSGLPAQPSRTPSAGSAPYGAQVPQAYMPTTASQNSIPPVQLSPDPTRVARADASSQQAYMPTTASQNSIPPVQLTPDSMRAAQTNASATQTYVSPSASQNSAPPVQLSPDPMWAAQAGGSSPLAYMQPTASQNSMPPVQLSQASAREAYMPPTASHNSMSAVQSSPGPMASTQAPQPYVPMAPYNPTPGVQPGGTASHSSLPPVTPGPTASHNSLPMTPVGSHPQSFMPHMMDPPGPTTSQNAVPVVTHSAPQTSPSPPNNPSPAIGQRIPVPDAFLNRTIALGSPQALQAVAGNPLADQELRPSDFDVVPQPIPQPNPSAKPGTSLSNLIALPPYNNQRSSRTDIPAQPSTASADFPGLFQPASPDDIPPLDKLVAGSAQNRSEAAPQAEGPLWKAPTSATVVPTTPQGAGPPPPWGQAGAGTQSGPSWGLPGLAQQGTDAGSAPQGAPPPPWGARPATYDDQSKGSWADASIPPESAIQALSSPTPGAPPSIPLPEQPDGKMTSSRSGARPFLQDNTGIDLQEHSEVTGGLDDGSDHTVQVSRPKSKNLDWNATPPTAPTPAGPMEPHYEDVLRETVAVPPPVDKKTPAGHVPFDVAALNAIPTPSVKAPKPMLPDEPQQQPSTPLRTPITPPSRTRYGDETDSSVRTGGSSALRFSNSRGGAESKKRVLITLSCVAVCIFVIIAVYILIGVKPKTATTESAPPVATQTTPPPSEPVPTSAIPTPAPPTKQSAATSTTIPTASGTPPVAPPSSETKQQPTTPLTVPTNKKAKPVIAKKPKKPKRPKAAKPAPSTTEASAGPKRRRAYSTVDSYMKGNEGN